MYYFLMKYTILLVMGYIPFFLQYIPHFKVYHCTEFQYIMHFLRISTYYFCSQYMLPFELVYTPYYILLVGLYYILLVGIYYILLASIY